jgi:hypothetical protein
MTADQIIKANETNPVIVDRMIFPIGMYRLYAELL